MSLISQLLDRRIVAYQRELIETHYAEVENMYRQIRGWRHDYRNHIQAMKSFAASGDMESIKKYLDHLDEDLSTVDMVIRTGNRMTDAILNSKISLAKSKHIPVIADAHIPMALKLSELDLCVIIGNLFDNAIEASMVLPGGRRMIRVYMEHEKHTVIHILYKSNSNEKRVLWLCLLLALLAVASNLTGLYIAPVILHKVETVAYCRVS